MRLQVVEPRRLYRQIADQIRDQLTAAGKRPPGLAVVIVGQDPASQIYVRNKHQATEAAGMRSVKRVLPATRPPPKSRDWMMGSTPW